MLSQNLNKEGFRGYIFSRPIRGSVIPQKVQNLVIREYSKKKNLFFKLSLVEYKIKNCFLMLNLILKELKNIDGIIFYSIFMLPEEKLKRAKFFDYILKNKKQVHFALEEIQFKNTQDLELIKEIFFIEKNKRKNLISIK